MFSRFDVWLVTCVRTWGPHPLDDAPRNRINGDRGDPAVFFRCERSRGISIMKYHVFYRLYKTIYLLWYCISAGYLILCILLLYKCCHMPDAGQSSKLGKCESWENACLTLQPCRTMKIKITTLMVYHPLCLHIQRWTCMYSPDLRS